ncbi:MAG: DUF4781 domain-containing protein, partial [Myxococcota bacterium]
KTTSSTFQDNPGLAAVFAESLGGTTTAQSGPADQLRRAFSTPNGRALLLDEQIHGAARLWAVDELMKGTNAVLSALSVDKPWEHTELLELFAKRRVGQFAELGTQAVEVSGKNIDNLIGVGLQAPFRSDLPQTPSAVEDALVQAIDGEYSFFENVGVVRRIAGDPSGEEPGGIRGAARQIGGELIRVATLPIQFSSQATGPIDLQLYRVEGQEGQKRYVDNIGRIYSSFENWRTSNALPPGRMTFPVDGDLEAFGQTSLKTENTPMVRDTFGSRYETSPMSSPLVAASWLVVCS